MGSGVLFNKRNWYGLVEQRALAFRQEYESIPDDMALDESFTQRMKERLTPHIPTLYRDRIRYEEVQPQDVQRSRQRPVVLIGSSQKTSLEYVCHVPFDGDPAVFDISPSATNGNVAEGEIKGQELLIGVRPPSAEFDIRAYIERCIGLVEWRLDHLRSGLAHLDQQLEVARRACMAARKGVVEAKMKIRQNASLQGLPVRKFAEPPAAASVAKSVEPERANVKLERWDIFMSHATADKAYVRGLVKALRDRDVTVWFDEDAVGWGESLRQRIKKGLLHSRFGIVVLSKTYLSERKWIEHELDGLFAREECGESIILPIWHGVDGEDIKRYDAPLSLRKAMLSETDSYPDIVQSVLEKLGRSRG